MLTTCQECGRDRATFHLDDVKPGKRPEDPPRVSTRHLCEPCAVKAGLMSGRDTQTAVPKHVGFDVFDYGHGSYRADCLTDRSKTIIIRARAIAAGFKRDEFSWGDLALALVREGTTAGLGELNRLGVNLGQLERQLVSALRSGESEIRAADIGAALLELSGLKTNVTDGDHFLLVMLRSGESPLAICLKHQAMDPEVAYRSVRRRLHESI